MKTLLSKRLKLENKIKSRKKGGSYFLEILGGILIVVLLIGAFNKFDYGTIVTKVMGMMTGLLDKAQGLWQ